MKKAMTILLTFIMVLQLIPIPAFATEEIATAEDLKAFLENPENVTVAEGSTLTVQISAENKFTNQKYATPSSSTSPATAATSSTRRPASIWRLEFSLYSCSNTILIT